MLKELNRQEMELYIAYEGINCPGCGGHRTNCDRGEFGEFIAFRNCWCIDCGLEWTEEFNVTHVVTDDGKDENDPKTNKTETFYVMVEKNA